MKKVIDLQPCSTSYEIPKLVFEKISGIYKE